MLANGELVLLHKVQAYEGCLGVVCAHAGGAGLDSTHEVYVRGLGTVVRRASDLRVLSARDVEAGVEWATPQEWRASAERSSCTAAMVAAIAAGDVEAAEAYADRVVAAEGRA